MKPAHVQKYQEELHNQLGDVVTPTEDEVYLSSLLALPLGIREQTIRLAKEYSIMMDTLEGEYDVHEKESMESVRLLGSAKDTNEAGGS